MEDENISITKFPHYCPSNACMNLFPDNKPQHFKIQLEHPYQLSGNWQVALHSIAYPHNWNNVKETDFEVAIQTTGNAGPIAKIALEATFEKGQYNSIADILAQLNIQLNNLVKTEIQNRPQAFTYTFQENEKYFEFKESSTAPKKIILTTKYDENAIILNKENRSLFGLLGFDIKSQVNIKNGTIAKYQPSLDLHFPSLYVYCPNLIKGVGVGETISPLLATVPVSGKMKEISYVESNNLVYVDLIQNYIKRIEIIIKDDRGENVDFLAGKVNLLLLFRRIS